MLRTMIFFIFNLAFHLREPPVHFTLNTLTVVYTIELLFMG